jgi:hypothetical protein
MSNVKLVHSTGNGTSIAAPAANPSSNITLKVPSTTGSAGQVLKVASANHSATNAELEWGTGGITAANDGVVKAWVNFNGTGTVAIRDHLNVSSITDNHTGTYTANFTTSFATVNYVALVSSGHSGNSSAPRGFETAYNYATGSVKFDFRDDTGNEADPQVACLLCIGDQ